jgi:hypothetical protein
MAALTDSWAGAGYASVAKLGLIAILGWVAIVLRIGREPPPRCNGLAGTDFEVDPESSGL